MNNHNDTPAPRPARDFSKLAAALLFAFCVGVMLYMFQTHLDEGHKTMISFLGLGAFLSAMQVL